MTIPCSTILKFKALENETTSLYHADYLLKQALEELNNAMYGTKIDCKVITFNEWVTIQNAEHESYYDHLSCLADFVAVKARRVANLKKVGD